MDNFNYGKEYFDCGIENSLSCYSNYRWLPELTIPMVMTYIDYLGITQTDKILDYGCAKGYSVKALRMLHRKAWGIDISEYAINCSDNDTRKYLEVITDSETSPFIDHMVFDHIISKDVFEHIPTKELGEILRWLRSMGRNMFVIVPLGDGNKFNIPAYELDVSHILKETPDWWKMKFEENGWHVKNFQYLVPGIKDNWANFPKGNGYFTLTNT